ncbi:MAG: hypothetical protein ABI543_07355 [Ignavibacteria bacterium]
MPAPGIVFDPPFDLHIVRGQSVILADLVKIGGQSISTYLAANPTMQLTFSANFKGGSLPGGWYSGLGIGIITDSVLGGIVQSDRPGPVDNIKNFHLTATVRDPGDSTSNEAVIRIHLHSSIKQAWLSPSILTVQKGINGFRCSVRARFDDDVEAEIGEIYDLNTGRVVDYKFGLTQLKIEWSSPAVNLISATGEITPVGAIALGLHDVSAVISCNGINLAQGGDPTVTANGQVFVADQLSGTRNDITASLVSTGNCPGFARIDEVPNILFIPDGFHIENSNVFNTIVDKYVSELTTGKVSSPFDLLNGSINFWKVFVTSGDEGGTTIGDIYLYDGSGNLKGYRVYEGRKPADSFLLPANWSLQEIIYKIGLSVRSDKSKSNSSLRNEWKSKTSLTPGDIDAIPNGAIDSWKLMGERRIPEEKDTALGITSNNYIAVLNDGNHNIIDFNPKRLSRDNLDTFLATLKDDAGNLIGPKFVKTGNTPGKDNDLIVFFTSAPLGRAKNLSPGGFFTPVRSEVQVHNISGTINDFKRSINVDNDTIEDLPLSSKGTLTHELGHSFALEDEYGEPPPLQSWDRKFINDPDTALHAWVFNAFSGASSLADWSSNTQHKQDLLSSPTPNIADSGIIDAMKIKWRFHRIKKCGVLASNPVQNGANYTITLKSGQADAFIAGDKVFIRRRKAEEFQLIILNYNYKVRIISSTTALETLFGIHLTVTVITPATNTIQATEGANTHTFIVRTGWTIYFTIGEVLTVGKNFVGEPIASMTRTASLTPATVSDTITYAVSSEFEVDSVNSGANQVVIKPASAGNSLGSEYTNPEPGSRMILYSPVLAPAAWGAQFKYAELISKKVIEHLQIAANAFPFNAMPDSSHVNAITEIIDASNEQNSSIPNSLVPCCSSRKKEIVGLYSGGRRYHGNTYHPAGHCFMRSHIHGNSYDEFCAVCRYILVDIIDPTKHAALDEVYSKRKIYPE